jgi:hypothetical protein
MLSAVLAQVYALKSLGYDRCEEDDNNFMVVFRATQVALSKVQGHKQAAEHYRAVP